MLLELPHNFLSDVVKFLVNFDDLRSLCNTCSRLREFLIFEARAVVLPYRNFAPDDEKRIELYLMDVIEMLPNLSFLHFFCVNNSDAMSSLVFARNAESYHSFPHMLSLKLSGWWNVRDETLCVFAKMFPNLNSLDLTDSHIQINPRVINADFPNLSQLHLPFDFAPPTMETKQFGECDKWTHFTGTYFMGPQFLENILSQNSRTLSSLRLTFRQFFVSFENTSILQKMMFENFLPNLSHLNLVFNMAWKSTQSNFKVFEHRTANEPRLLKSCSVVIMNNMDHNYFTSLINLLELTVIERLEVQFVAAYINSWRDFSNTSIFFYVTKFISDDKSAFNACQLLQLCPRLRFVDLLASEKILFEPFSDEKSVFHLPDLRFVALNIRHISKYDVEEFLMKCPLLSEERGIELETFDRRASVSVAVLTPMKKRLFKIRRRKFVPANVELIDTSYIRANRVWFDHEKYKLQFVPSKSS